MPEALFPSRVVKDHIFFYLDQRSRSLLRVGVGVKEGLSCHCGAENTQPSPSFTQHSVDAIHKYGDELHGIFNLCIFKRGHFLLIFNHTYECLYHNLWWKIDLQNWRWKIKDQDQFVKITSSDQDCTKDQDQLSDLDLGDQISWSFYNSVSTHSIDFSSNSKFSDPWWTWGFQEISKAS